MSFFQEISVWKSIDDNASVKFRCFHDLVSGKYCVQSADFFYLPIDEQQLKLSEKQVVELFTELSPIDRCEWFNSLVEAISRHEVEFGNK